MVNKIISLIIKYKLEFILAIISTILSVISVVYFLSNDLSLANGDAIARLNISRRVVDSITPGFAQLGYVWLPINHILMLPLIWIDSFYYSGMAGIIISMLSFIAASIFIFKISELLMNRLAGILAFVLFITNPNILYMQATPLTEMFYVFCILGGVFYLIKWARDKKTSYLITGSVFLLLSTLSRYDGWFLAIVALILVGFYELTITKNWKKTEATIIIFGAMTFIGSFLWLVWNFLLFGNPLYFAVGRYSVKFQQLVLKARGLLPSEHNLWSSFLHTFYSGQLIIGWSVLILGTIGFCYLIWKAIKGKQYWRIFFLIFLMQFFFYIISLFTGNGVILVPQLKPYLMHNIRYGITFLPFFIIAAGIILSRFRWVAFIILPLALFEYGMMVADGKIITLNESLNGLAGRDVYISRINAGNWLQRHYDGGLILSDMFKNDAAAFYSKVHFRNWVNSGNTEKYSEAINNPKDTVDWILISNEDEMSEIFNNKEKLKEEGFVLIYKEQDIEIYKKMNVEAFKDIAELNSKLTKSEDAQLFNRSIEHIIQEGENLWVIAKKYYNTGLKWANIAKDNNLTNPNLIYPGNVLNIFK